MSADRETNHDMAHEDIALLLADAAKEAEIGAAPTQAVIRGGRRRRARRWAVAAAVTVVIVGSTGALVLAGLPGADRAQQPPMTTYSPRNDMLGLIAEHRTVIAEGTDAGEKWQVYVNLWKAPRDESEAVTQLGEMTQMGSRPVGLRDASRLIGNVTYFVHRNYGTGGSPLDEDMVPETNTLSGTAVEFFTAPMTGNRGDPERLVVGRVAGTAETVTCTWKDGTTTKVHRDSAGDLPAGQPAIRAIEGSPWSWFVCLAPKGTLYKSVEVTK